MRAMFLIAISGFIFPAVLTAQAVDTKSQTPTTTQAQTDRGSSSPSSNDSEDVAALRADISRLKALLTQMRTNLAFVQTSQTPLKHQFELEADAWQVIVEQMDRRLKETEQRHEKK